MATTRVQTNAIENDAVTSAKIAANAVGSSEIANDAVTSQKLSGSQSGSAPIYGVRAWGIMTGGDTSNPQLTTSGNLQNNITRSGSANATYTIRFNTPMPNSNYAVLLTIASDNDHICQVINNTRTTTSFQFKSEDAGGSSADPDDTNAVHIMVVG